MHAKGTALTIIGDGLYHRAENVWIDGLPVQFARAQQIGPGDARKARTIRGPREEAAIDIGKGFRPWPELRGFALFDLDVHRAENFGDDLMRVARCAVAHLLHGLGEQVRLGKCRCSQRRTKYQPRHQLIEFVAPRLGRPIGIVLQKLDIELVEPPRRLDIDGVVGDLPNGRNAG